MLAIVFFTSVNACWKNQFKRLWVLFALCSYFRIFSSANTVKAIFSSLICIFTFMPLHLSSDAEFQAVLRKHSTASLSSKICRIVLLSANSRFILYPLNLSVVWSSWTQTMHHTTHSYVPLFPHIFAHISKKERPESLLPCDDYTILVATWLTHSKQQHKIKQKEQIKFSSPEITNLQE